MYTIVNLYINYIELNWVSLIKITILNKYNKLHYVT